MNIRQVTDQLVALVDGALDADTAADLAGAVVRRAASKVGLEGEDLVIAARFCAEHALGLFELDVKGKQLACIHGFLEGVALGIATRPVIPEPAHHPLGAAPAPLPANLLEGDEDVPS